MSRRRASAWTAREVADHISSLGPAYGQYAKNFVDNGVDGSMIGDLSDADLSSDLGVVSGLHRKKILKELEKLSAAPSSSAPSNSAPRAPTTPMQQPRWQPPNPRGFETPLSAAKKRSAPLPPEHRWGSPPGSTKKKKFNVSSNSAATNASVRRGVNNSEVARKLMELKPNESLDSRAAPFRPRSDSYNNSLPVPQRNWIKKNSGKRQWPPNQQSNLRNEEVLPHYDTHIGTAPKYSPRKVPVSPAQPPLSPKDVTKYKGPLHGDKLKVEGYSYLAHHKPDKMSPFGSLIASLENAEDPPDSNWPPSDLTPQKGACTIS
eukprot:UC4_evm5s67